MEDWEQYKKIYKRITLSEQAINESWHKLSQRLPAQEKIIPQNIARLGFAFLGLVVLLAVGLAGVSQQAKPGDPLYSVKQITDTVTSKIFQDLDTTTEKTITPVIKKPNPTVSPTSTPSPTPTAAPEAKGEQTKAEIQQKIQENKLLPPQTGQAMKNNAVNGNANRNEIKHENQGNNSGNDQDKPKNENAEKKGNSQGNPNKK